MKIVLTENGDHAAELVTQRILAALAEKPDLVLGLGEDADRRRAGGHAEAHTGAASVAHAALDTTGVASEQPIAPMIDSETTTARIMSPATAPG